MLLSKAVSGIGAPSPLTQTALACSKCVRRTWAAQAGGAMYGVLLAGERVIALAQPRAQPLAPADLLLLASFVTGSDSFRAAAESFSPICLPAYNPSAFLHAYVQYLDAVRTVQPACAHACLPVQGWHCMRETLQGFARSVAPLHAAPIGERHGRREGVSGCKVLAQLSCVAPC